MNLSIDVRELTGGALEIEWASSSTQRADGMADVIKFEGKSYRLRGAELRG
jgi:hypothetical protein